MFFNWTRTGVALAQLSPSATCLLSMQYIYLLTKQLRIYALHRFIYIKQGLNITANG